MTNPRSPRLLISFHDMALGGIQKKIVDISKYLIKHQPDTNVRISLRRRIGIFINQIPSKTKISSPYRPIYRLGGIRFFLWMVKEILIFSPTHILTFMDFSAIPTIAAAKFVFWKKIKITIAEDILTSKYLDDTYSKAHKRLKQNLIQKYYPQADSILVQTPVQKKDLENILNLPNSPKIISTPNWLPLDYPYQETYINKDIDILYVGRIAAQKNLTKFIEIIKQISHKDPHIKATIVGSGEEDDKISQLIKKNNLQKNITRVPQIPNPQDYYLKAKYFLLTSDYEGFPLTIMEAIASGCYPVSYDLPEIRQFFNKDTSSYIYQTNDQAVKLLSSPPPKSLSYYQSKLKKLQQQHIQKYIDFCLN